MSVIWAHPPPAQTGMQLALVNTLLSDEQPTLGEAIQIAKASIVDSDVRRTWILLGDPTLRLKPFTTEVLPFLGNPRLGSQAD